MKNKIFIAMVFIASSLLGQTNAVKTMTGSGDSISNGASDFVVSQVQANFKTISIQAVVTKSTGTLTGVGLLQGSNDGVNYVAVAASADSMTITNQTTNTKIWVIDGSPYEYYRVYFSGYGTNKFYISGSILGNGQSLTNNAVVRAKSVYGLTLDTVTNTATNTLKVRAQQWYKTISIQAVVTKLSGTAAGTVTLQGSNDGTNYNTVSTSYLLGTFTAPYTTGGVATMSVSNITTNTKIFTLIGSPYEYYRLSYTGSGTMSCTLKGYVLGNK